jgi:branched-chain amino acid transport system ATP-binding protein
MGRRGAEGATVGIDQEKEQTGGRDPQLGVVDEAHPSGEHEPLTLCVEDLTIRFGGVVALDRVDLRIDANEVCGIIGPNGAGKSTLFKCITGALVPTSGGVRLGSFNLINVPRHRRARLGIVQTFQEGGLFPTISVIDNLLTGARSRRAQSCARSERRSLFGRSSRERSLHDEASALLETYGLSHLSRVDAGSLPFGTQRIVEVLRALMCKPRFLLMDEPGAGMSSTERRAFMDIFPKVKADGIAVVLVEHNMPMVMELCERIVVLNEGRVIARGAPAELRANVEVQEAYLGRDGRRQKDSSGAGEDPGTSDALATNAGAPAGTVSGTAVRSGSAVVGPHDPEVAELEVRDLIAGYGALQVLHGISISLPAQKISLLVGPNGAGKTTLLRAICGSVKVSGKMSVAGSEIAHRSWTPEQMLERGVAMVPSGRGTLRDLTVEENLLVGGARLRRGEARQHAERWLEEFPRLRARRKIRAGLLSGGEQQMLAIARALMSDPKYVLLDEASLGLAPVVVEQVFDIVARLNKTLGLGVLIVEQGVLSSVVDIADRCYVLNQGEIVLSGSAEQLARNEALRAAYFGV